MDTIIERNDKFETVKVIMELLCKELGISVESGYQEILDGLRRVTMDYYAAMDEFKILRNTGQDINSNQSKSK